MAKKNANVATQTPEEVVAQNGGLENATPVVENNATEVAVVAEVVAPVENVETAEVAEVTEAVAEAAPVEAPVKEVATAVVETAKERTMDCLGLKNHTCRIGGNVIHVTKDKVDTFTVGVATVLQRANVVIVK